MTVAGFFSGIGGFELAFAEAGFETTLLSELDPAAAAVLKARFPHADLRRDIEDVEALPKDASILTAGFPCQNLSMAGDKTGLNGQKSGVVDAMFRTIERSLVPTVVIENVYFMLHLARGNAMRWLVENFERLGYLWAYRVLDTMGFGLPHRRRRVYMIASRVIDPRMVLFADESASVADPPTADLTKPLGFYWTEGRSGIGLTVDGIPPLKVGSAIGIASAPAVLFPDGEVLMPSISACERLQGFPEGWTSPAIGFGRAPGWRLVGNAVSVPVARWVAERIRSPKAVIEFEQAPMDEGKRWPDAGWNVGNGRTTVVASDRPTPTPKPSISVFRNETWSRLSDRALKGFIQRGLRGGLSMPPGFIDRLRSQLLCDSVRG